MRMALDCVPCYLRQCLRALNFAGMQQLGEDVLRKVMERLLELDWTLTPMEVGFEVYRILREVTGIDDPYAEVKSRSNELALSMLPQLRELVKSSHNALRTAVLVSVAGNALDYGALEKVDLRKALEQAFQKPAIDMYSELEEELRAAESMLLFADNAGEIVFDKLMIEVILEELGPKHVTLVVRSTPIINDATLRDAVEAGLTRIPYIRILELPSSSLAEYEEHKQEVIKWIEESDIVIAKGQANYELLSGIEGVFFLLKVKCQPIARELLVPVGSTVIKRSKSF
ncbi:MAG: hypothetical protein DRJ43_04620 [Thermoprotei archaeon]|nr:MAG: hypothetical protein DRJ43_04620 [Thermoprotei archaeon]